MTVLGVDPSLNSTGWAIVNDNYSIIDYGSIVFKSGGDHILKIRNISQSIIDIIKLHEINRMAIETTFVNMNSQSSLKLAMVRGACVGACQVTGIEFSEYSPRTVKMTICGTGAAGKKQVEDKIYKIIREKLSIANNDESDAIAIALTDMLLK